MKLKRIIIFIKGPRKKIKMRTMRTKLENIIPSIWIEWWNWKLMKLLYKGQGKKNRNSNNKKQKTFGKRWKSPLRLVLILVVLLCFWIFFFYIYLNTKLPLILHDNNNNKKNYFKSIKLALNASIEIFCF